MAYDVVAHPLSSSPTHPDAALLLLGRSFDVAWSADRKFDQEIDQLPPSIYNDARGHDRAVLYDRTLTLATQIEQITAVTLDGLHMKLGLLAWHVEPEELRGRDDSVLLASLSNDVSLMRLDAG